ALGSGVNGNVWALATSDSNLYAGGYFTMAGGNRANYVARWDGSSWSALGTGMDHAVCALVASGSNLYAGGFFTNAGAAVVNRVAKWDGTNWTALGSGLSSGGVSALAILGTDLYLGGDFLTAGTHFSAYIARAYLPPLPTLSARRSGADV